MGRREELPARSPWAAVPTYLAALDPESVLLGGLAVGACLFPVNGHLQGAGVSCGLRPQFLASWQPDVMLLCGAAWPPHGSQKGDTQLLLRWTPSSEEEREGEALLLFLPVLTISA